MNLLIAVAVAAGAVTALPSTPGAQTPSMSDGYSNVIATRVDNPEVKAIGEAKKAGACDKMTNGTLRWCLDRESTKGPMPP